MSKKGEGFAPPNYTQTPNTLFDLLPVISNAELRITLTLVRETHGWHRQRTDMLSVTELAALAGLSESSAKTGIKEATQRGTLKRFKTRDHQNRPTYKYGLVITSEVTREEFKRPNKQALAAMQDDEEQDSLRQNLTGSASDGMNSASGQNLTGSPEDSSGQNLTGSYKEQKNPIQEKERREENATRSAHQESQEDGAETGQEGPADAGAADAARPDTQGTSQGALRLQGRQNEPAASTEYVPGAAVRIGEPRTTEEYLRRKLSHRFVDDLLEEAQPLGVDRRRDWFALPLERVKELLQEAVNTHDKHKVKVPTRMKDLLDKEIRRSATSSPAEAAGKYDRSTWSD